jgi:hypothetical protein
MRHPTARTTRQEHADLRRQLVKPQRQLAPKGTTLPYRPGEEGATVADFYRDGAYDAGRAAGLPPPRQDVPRVDGAAVPTEPTPVRGRWRTAAWLFLAVAAVSLVAGVVVGDGLLLAAGLVLAGISGHLFTPEYVRGRGPGPPGR